MKSGVETHLLGTESVAEESDAEDCQMLDVETLPPTAEHSVGIEGEGQHHPRYCLRQDRVHRSAPQFINLF